MTLTEYEKLADFYVVDLFDMWDDKTNDFVIPTNPTHGLKHDEVSHEDFEAIAQFGRIIKNYQKLKRLTDETK